MRPTVAEGLHFASGPYRLHGELAYPEAGRPAGAAVLASPHPLLGGNMHNNVVRALAAGLAGRGLLTLRFDYRGVGLSEGPAVDVAAHLARFWQTSHAPDEMALADDVQAAVAALRAATPDVPAALVGYSFGCALLPHVRVGGPPCPRVLIAPTVGKHDYSSYKAVNGPLLVIASEDDFATDSGRLRAWFDGLNSRSHEGERGEGCHAFAARAAAEKCPQPNGPRKHATLADASSRVRAQVNPGRQLILKRFDNHFFRGHEGWLVEAVFPFLRDAWRD
jgi:alpha/beta superfamily hydrolase